MFNSATPWPAVSQVPLSSATSQSLLKLLSFESVMLCNHLILCCPLLLPSVFPSIRVFSNESALCNKWPKYQSFSNSPFSEYSELISFRIDWLDLLAVQGTLKSLLQHHSSKASILRHPKNVQTTVQLGSFHILARLCSKSFKLGFSRTWNGILFSHKKKSDHM